MDAFMPYDCCQATLPDRRRARVLRLRFAALSLVALLAACKDMPAAPAPAPTGAATAIFAGGCFWCVEQDFEKVPGVIEVEAGYTGGWTPDPDYAEVSSGRTGHAEAVRVIYDPQRVGYSRLLEHFWRHIDPTVKDRQFCDVGTPYRSAIFWQNEEQRHAAEASREALTKSGAFPAIHTEVTRAGPFWLAEDYHQDYYRKNPVRYTYYRYACGRDARIEEVWRAWNALRERSGGSPGARDSR
jgi:peptide-methionine (S)-S-oxide reductase